MIFGLKNALLSFFTDWRYMQPRQASKNLILKVTYRFNSK